MPVVLYKVLGAKEAWKVWTLVFCTMLSAGAGNSSAMIYKFIGFPSFLFAFVANKNFSPIPTDNDATPAKMY